MLVAQPPAEVAMPTLQMIQEDSSDDEDISMSVHPIFDFRKIEKALDQLAAQKTTGLKETRREEKKKRGGCKERRKAKKRRRREEVRQRLKRGGVLCKAIASSKATSRATVAKSVLHTPWVEEQTLKQQHNPFLVPREASKEHENPGDKSSSCSAADDSRVDMVSRCPNDRTIFVTNLSFKISEDDLRCFFQDCGPLRKVVLSKSKATGRPLGFAHVVFESPSGAQAGLLCDGKLLHDRVARIALAMKDSPVKFELPSDWEADIRKLVEDRYEGMNISTVKDAWEKQHPGQKMNVLKYGFKNFSMAIKSVSGLQIETHMEKSLTLLAFLSGSVKHLEFRKRKAEDKRSPSPERDQAPTKRQRQEEEQGGRSATDE